MKLIVNNYLLFTSKKDLNKSLLKYFFERLGIFFSIDLHKCPNIVFTSSINKIKKYYGGDNFGSAFYSENTNTVVFYLPKWKIKSKQFRYNVKQLQGEINVDLNNFTYLIPLSDLYHELIHSIQYYNGQYEYTDLLEATNEIITYIITGQWNIEYLKEAFSLWFIFRYILKMKQTQFYVFLRNCIVKKDFDKRYFLNNQNFIKFLVKKYDGNFKNFLTKFKNDFFVYYDDYKEEFEKYLTYIHNLIFYKY